jgi:hypothetical protein
MWGSTMGEIIQLRRAQAITALNQAIALRPDLTQAHGLLAGLYGEMRYLDLSLKHLRNYQELREKEGPGDPARAEAFREEQTLLQREIQSLGKRVEKREDEYMVGAAGRPVLERAMLAIRKELAGKARDMLLESHVTAFGPQGMVLELELLLQSGRARDVGEWMGAEVKAMMRPDQFHELRCLALAATGEYARAEEECTQLTREMVSRLGGRGSFGFRDVMSLLIGQAVLDNQPAGKNWPELFVRSAVSKEFRRRVLQYADDLRRGAKAKVLRGLLCLEEGEVVEAELDFREALDLWGSTASADSGRGLDFSGRDAAEGYLQLLESAWKQGNPRP